MSISKRMFGVKGFETASSGAMTLTLTGVEELNQFMEQLGKKLTPSILVRALRYALKPMQDSMINKAPESDKNIMTLFKVRYKTGKGFTVSKKEVGGGSLKRSITIRTSTKVPPAAWLGPTADTRWYARFVELGTNPHDIYPKNKEYLHFVLPDGNEVFTKHAHVNGITPRPFIRPAYDMTIAKTKVLLKERLHKKLTEVKKKKR